MASTRKPASKATTRTIRDGVASPRLPHERDESSDTRQQPSRSVIRQAGADLASGKQATDRSEATDAAYQRQKEPAAPAPGKRPPGKR